MGVQDKVVCGKFVGEIFGVLRRLRWCGSGLVLLRFQLFDFLVFVARTDVEVGDDGGDYEDGGHEGDGPGEDFGKFACVSDRIMHDYGIKERDKENLQNEPGKILQVVERLAFMGVVHKRSAERQQQCTTRHDDQRIREELRPAVVLNIVPSTLERREYIDER